ncbi:MAG: ferritin family protein [Pseudomonadota bacterium]
MSEASERALGMLAKALEKEEQGMAFYGKAATATVNPLGKDIFVTLMAEEGVHIRRIKKIYDTLQGGGSWSDEWKAYAQNSEDLRRLFRERMVNVGSKVTAETSDMEALDIALEMEQGAVDFYEQALGKAEDPIEKEFIKLMIQEERSHFASIADVKQYLMNPESWFSEKEHHGLDGA